MRQQKRVFLLVAAVGCVAFGVFAAGDDQTTGPIVSNNAAEAAPAPSLECFNGAYYRKAVSSFDAWSGIEGVIKLPTPQYDESRRNPRTGRFLDNASVYMGGRANDQEIDCGVTWEVIRLPDGSVSKQGMAFRPFWRNEKWNSAPAKPEFYYFPGDEIRMSCVTTESGKLVMKIDLLKRADKASTYPKTSSFSAEFDAKEFGPGVAQQFKRVNAIDQSGNEGKPVKPTSATVSGAEWHEVVLMRGDARLPMVPARFTDMRCPDPQHVEVDPAQEPSGEKILIKGRP